MFGYSVKDSVITVPEFATAHERRALLDAADVAGLTVLSLMDENTAAALQHAISQTYEEDTNVMFYNMGANSIQVTIVTFGPKKIKDRNVGKLTVKGKGWDATVGGWWFDLKLTDVFAEGFNAKVGICHASERPGCGAFAALFLGVYFRSLRWFPGDCHRSVCLYTTHAMAVRQMKRLT